MGIKTLVDGMAATIWRYQYRWGNDTNFIRVSADAVKIFSLTYSRTTSDLQYPRIIYLTPFNVNKRWNGVLLNVDSFRVTNQFDVVAPLQTFTSCYQIYHHYVGLNTELNDTAWFKPNIGLVASHNYDYNNGPVLYRTSLLKSFLVH